MALAAGASGAESESCGRGGVPVVPGSDADGVGDTVTVLSVGLGDTVTVVSVGLGDTVTVVSVGLGDTVTVVSVGLGDTVSLRARRHRDSGVRRRR